MSRQQERDEFLIWAGRQGLRTETARHLLRYATTLHRLAEAQCRPADHGSAWKTTECEGCGSSWAPSVLKGTPKRCPDCRTTTLAIEAVRDTGFEVDVRGDPRGYVLRLFPASGPEEDRENGRERGIGVPAGS